VIFCIFPNVAVQIRIGKPSSYKLTKNVVYTIAGPTRTNHQFLKMLLYLDSDIGPLYATAVDVSFYFCFPSDLKSMANSI
jgi:hypothetical protein